MADFIYYLTYNGKTPVVNERIPIYEWVDPTTEYLISQNTIVSPTVSTGTYSRVNNDWWEAAVTTTQNTTWPYAGADYQNIDLFLGTGSSITSTDNFLGSRWGITGGSGQYSVEYPAFQIQLGDSSLEPYSINQYFSFDPVTETSTPTYIYIENKYYPSITSMTYSINWVENGVASKNVTGNGYNRFKVLFDRNTNMSYVYGAINFPSGTSDYDALLGTYSFDSAYVGNAPYGWVAWLPNNTALTFGYSTINAYGPLIMTNYQVNGLTGSNFGGTAGTPDISQRFDLGWYEV